MPSTVPYFSHSFASSFALTTEKKNKHGGAIRATLPLCNKFFFYVFPPNKLFESLKFPK